MFKTYRITYTDPNTNEQREHTETFESTPYTTARELAIATAYVLSDGSIDSQVEAVDLRRTA